MVLEKDAIEPNNHPPGRPGPRRRHRVAPWLSIGFVLAFAFAIPGHEGAVSEEDRTPSAVASDGAIAVSDSPAAFRAVVPLLTCGTCEHVFPSAIDYSRPADYLVPGPQSTFTPDSVALVQEELGQLSPGIQGVGDISRWVFSSFQTIPSSGQNIGKTNVNSLLDTRTFTGCHDTALMTTAVLRLHGYPAIMVDTAGIQWVMDYIAGETQAHIGHVFAEVFVDGRWILLECGGGGAYVGAYNPASPVIAPAPGAGMDPLGYFVLFKGSDPQSYGVTDSEHLADRFREFAELWPTLDPQMTAYEWKPLP